MNRKIRKSMFAAVRRKELKTKIAALSREIAELKFEEKSIIQVFDKADAVGMKKVEAETSKSKARIVKLDAQEVKFIGVISLEKEKRKLFQCVLRRLPVQSPYRATSSHRLRVFVKEK